MTSRHVSAEQFEVELTAWLDERALGPKADQVIDHALARTARTRQLPRWMAMDVPMRRVPVPRASAIVLAAALLLLALLAAVIVLPGRQQPLPAPFGPAAAGLLAFDAEGDIVVANADGTGRRVSAATDAREFGPAWSTDGQRLAFWSIPANGSARVVVVNADGTDRLELGGDLGWRPDDRGWPPVWSPDGSRLLIPTAPGDLFLAHADGSAVTPVGSDTGGRFYPVWSPTGTEIAYVTGGSGGGYITVMDLEAGTETRVNQRAGGGPTWSPDGSRLAYWAPVQPGDIFVATRSGDSWSETLVMGGETDDVGPTWSNDGSKIAFVRLSGDVGSVLVMPAGGGEARVVAEESAGATFARICWSPDDRFVTALSTRAGASGQGFGYVLLPVDGSDRPTAIPATGIHTLDACAWQRMGR